MKNKVIAILSAAVITIGVFGGVVFAKDINNFNLNSQNIEVKDTHKEMIKLMRENGFKDAARYMQTGDYVAMSQFMEDISEEDYQRMIDIMKENGYGYMAEMMESIGRDEMIEMHNSMGGMQGMHFYN